MRKFLDYPPYLDYPKPYTPPTKADRLRVKTDEELAKYLVEIGWDCHSCSEHERLENEPLLRREKCDEDCEKHCLEWLKQPAEDDCKCATLMRMR